MYKHLFLLTAVAIGLHACGPVYVVQQTPPPAPAPAPAPPANPEDVSYQTFYDQLSPYGQWIQDPDYGYVWMPDVSPDFKPYATNGHWVYTDEGWAWDSGYPWGWAAFHYGRWFFRDGYGWMWIPGADWAPAWVSWRNSDDYYGWAPMEPGISVSVAYSSGYNPPPHYWSFVPHQYVASPQINNYYVHETNNITIINRTTVINNTTVINHYENNRYGAGPDPNEVGRFTGAPLRPTPVRESRAPGGPVIGGGFAVYRPRVNAAPPAAGNPHVGGGGSPAYAPASFRPLSNARPVNRTNYNPGPVSSPSPATSPAPVPVVPANRPPGNQPQGSQPQGNQAPVHQQPFNNQPNQPYQSNPQRSNQSPPNQPQPAASQPNTVTPTPGQGRFNRPQPTGQPSVQQPAPVTRQAPPRRTFTPAATQNTNQPKPVVNAPKPAPQQHKLPQPPKKDEKKNPDNR